MPKWLVQTLCDSNLATPLHSRTHSGSQHASYAQDCYAFVVANLWDEEEPVSFEETQNSKNWVTVMQIEYDAIVKNDMWYLIDLLVGRKSTGTRWVYKLKCKHDGSVE